jgi:hypothetical protein
MMEPGSSPAIEPSGGTAAAPSGAPATTPAPSPSRPGTPPPPTAGRPSGDADAGQAWREYQAAPTDEAAFTHLLKTAEERAEKRVLGTLEQREQEQVATRTRASLRQTIDQHVATIAPEVPRRLFWFCANQAQAETPAHLTDPAERLQWQTGRALAIAREEMEPVLNRGRQAGPQGNAAGQPSAGAQPSRFIDQMKALRRKVNGW